MRIKRTCTACKECSQRKSNKLILCDVKDLQNSAAITLSLIAITALPVLELYKVIGNDKSDKQHNSADNECRIVRCAADTLRTVQYKLSVRLKVKV